MGIHRKKLDIDIPRRAEVCRMIVADHRSQTYTAGNNFKLDDAKYCAFTHQLYQRFLEESKRLFRKLKILDKSREWCWAYVINKHEYRGGIHDHVRTSTINGVFYLNIPQTGQDTADSGTINFYDRDYKKYLSYQPMQDDLLIFPNYVLHEPGRIDTEEYRISINMEIICEDVWGKSR